MSKRHMNRKKKRVRGRAGWIVSGYPLGEDCIGSKVRCRHRGRGYGQTDIFFVSPSAAAREYGFRHGTSGTIPGKPELEYDKTVAAARIALAGYPPENMPA